MKRVLSILLAACMLLTLPPVTVLAEGVTSTGLRGEIIEFDELSTTTMTVPLGTELKDLELPKSLMATVSTATEAENDVPEEPVVDNDSSIVQTEQEGIDKELLLSVNSSTTADHFAIETDTDATPSSAVDSSTMPIDPIESGSTNTEVEENQQTVSDNTPSVDPGIMPVDPIDPIDATSSNATVAEEIEQPGSGKTPVEEWEEEAVSIPVTWVSTPEYEKDTPGVYVFTPEIKGYTVSADLPEITVTVGKAARLMMLPASQAQWGEAGADGALPTSWEGSGTLIEAMSYANELSSGTAYIQLLMDINKDNHSTWPLSFAADKTTILDLNGHNIDRGQKVAWSKGNVIDVSGTLTLKDDSTEIFADQGCITGGYCSGNKGGCVLVIGSFIMQGGNITGNKTVNDKRGGGGVSLYDDKSTFVMEGGSITNNEALNWGGGVYAYYSFTVTGGSITDNKSLNGGIFCDKGFTVGGSAVIKDNTLNDSTTAGNVYFGNDTIISVSTSNPLTTGASIGVNTWTEPSSGNPISITTNSSSDYSEYFVSDKPVYKIVNTGTGSEQVVKLEWQKLVTVSGAVNVGTTGADVSGLTVKLYDSADTNFKNPKGSATTGTDGTYSIPDVPSGSYVVRVAGVPGKYAASATNVVVNDEDVSNINITLETLVTESIEVSSTTHKSEYKVGDALDVSNLKITVLCTNGSTYDKDVTMDMVSGFDSSAVAASQSLTITFDGKTTDYTISVSRAAYSGPPVNTDDLIGTGDNRPTSESITINAVAGNEYFISTSKTPPITWPTSGSEYYKAAVTGMYIFTGLSAATEYYIHVRVAETDTVMPSASAYKAQYTLPAAVDASVVTINYKGETLHFDNIYEVSTTGDFSSTIPDDGSVQPGTTYYVRVKAAGGVPASEPVSFTAPARPATPVAVATGNIKKTDTTITITSTVSTQEYSVDGGVTWKNGNGSLNFKDLTANQSYSVKTRITATDTSFASVSTSISVTTKMAAGTAPTVTTEILIGTGDNRPTSESITINTVAGNEYFISTSATAPLEWPTSGDNYFKSVESGIHTFTGLTVATKYYIYVRVAETETAMPSESARIAQYTQLTTFYASVVTINYMEETLSFDHIYEVSTTHEFGTTIPDGGPVQPGTTYYVRIKAAGGVPASEAVSFTAASRPASPAAVTSENVKKTDTTITIKNTVTTQDYSVDGGVTWRAGNGSLTFTGLTANHPYRVMTRIPATATTFQSVSAPLIVTTKTASAALNDSGVTYSVMGGTITGLGNTYEYSMDEGLTWLTAPVTGVIFTKGSVLVRRKETDDAMPSLPQLLGTIAAAAVSKDPTLESKTDNSVTLTAMNGYEYSRDGGLTWQSSNVFSNLNSGTAYSFIARIQATNTAFPGVVSTELGVITNETPSNGSSGASGSGSDKSDSSAKPTEPVTGAADNKAAIDNQGNASVTVTDKNISDAIASAKAEAARKGVNAGEIKVVIHVSTSGESTDNFTVNLPITTQQQMISNKISGIELAVDRPDITVGINLAAVTEINRQANQDVQLIVRKTDGSTLGPAAKAIIENRPVYDFKASYQDGSKHVTNFGGGRVYVSIPYTPADNEATGCLYMTYVNENGEISRVSGSAYDTNSRSLIFTTDHFSVYGVGYTAPAVNFIDIGKHWAKESIDYVAGRGLLGGNEDGTFNPDAVITRGDFITALGRLASVDTNAYTTSTDGKDSSSLPYIQWAYSKGIIQRAENTQFAPDRAITRQEAAVILQNYAKATDEQFPASRNAVNFADASSIDSNCRDAVKALQQAGILMGEQNNRFNPTANITRGKASAMLHRYIKLTIDPATAQGWTQNDDGQYLYYKAGIMVSGKWLEIDSKWYYFNADGSLAISTNVDGYEIDENGVMKTK